MTSVLRLGLCLAVLAVSSAWAGPFSVTSVETSGTTFGTGTSSATAVERMRITQGGLVGISNTSPIAKLDVVGTISASDAIQVSGSSLTCSSAIKGAIRYSNTSSTLEYCNSTAWTSLGPSDTLPVSFSVHKNGSAQSGMTSSMAKLTWSTEVFDNNNNFASDRFTPTVRGRYLITGAARFASQGNVGVSIFKNGANYASTYSNGTGNLGATVNTIVDMNGTTDYVELYASNDNNANALGSTDLTYFAGSLLGPQVGGGGTATPAGSTADVQFNNAGTLAADTGNFTYASGLLKAPTISGTLAVNTAQVSATNGYIASKLGVGRVAPVASLDVLGTISASDAIQVSGSSLTCSSAI